MTIRTLFMTAVAALSLAAGVAVAASYPEAPIVYDKPVRGVIFSHKAHVDKGLGCDMCHNHLFEQQAKKVQANKDFVMESLYQGKYCGTCHNGSLAFASNTRCATCHIGVKGDERSKNGDKAEKKGH
ncbi:cytochrome c3 family protein [Trichlorobacter lovleyi]|uniref:cytochrome c3 family protein n=1 Tax=Trichlorobacter lovleyi TaxID=313985 RepID=UPI00224046CD|nr:cytochrome c3 family protein [Trichlorobacter lovleyi]QOX80322.1 cytochrome c3 family protein [Trichlorobacter lovleyi]